MPAAKSDALVQLSLFERSAPTREQYLETLEVAKGYRTDPERLQDFLDWKISLNDITQSDAVCIWRGFVREYRTPFDVECLHANKGD